jgi:valyl-tRNA synthetase
MPFITEEIYCTLLPEEETIMTTEWPVYRDDRNFPQAEALINTYIELVRGIRNIRMEMNVPNGTKTDLYLVGKDEAGVKALRTLTRTIPGMERMVFAKNIEVREDKAGIGDDAVTVVLSNATAYIPLDELVDKEKEIARLTAENEKMDKEIARAEGMLKNPNFVNKAPAAKVEAERAKLEKYKAMKQQIEEQLKRY